MTRNSKCCGASLSVSLLVLLASMAVAQETALIAGQNVNMVSGTQWPDGDPFLQRQNEPMIAISTRNLYHLAAGSNDYRTVDLPGLPEGKTTGDSALSFYTSDDGGDRWTSTLLPGYPQDMSALGQASPIFGFEAFADPGLDSGINGLFHYSGIAFNRGENAPSAGFVATYMDLNNDERGNTIHYVGTSVYDQNLDGSSFIDKPWIAVDLPRAGANFVTLDVNTDDGIVPQTVECGNIYVAYARIQGEDTAAVRSQIMFAVSEDCGQTFSIPIELTGPDTINQGAAVAVEPNTGRIQVAWRQFKHATLSCTYKANFWRTTPEAWPVEQLELAGMLLRKGASNKVVVELADTDDDLDTEPFDEFDFSDDADRPSGVLRQLLAAWLNSLSGADASTITDVLAEAEAWLVENPLGTHPKGANKRRGNDLRKILRDFNKGKFGPGKCEDMMGSDTNGMLGGLNPNAIMVVSSSDGGNTFSAPVAASGPNYFPFEQGTTEFSFRTTGYPTMTFDGLGRSYIAYSTRGLAVPNFDEMSGDGRIVVTTSMDGTNWTFPLPIDEPEQPGHQIMPAFESTRGKVFLLYYDFRSDVSGVHDRFVVDLPVDPTIPRHSVDVRVAQALAADVPVFTDYSVLDLPSTQASRYPYLILDSGGMPVSLQTQYNPPNLPMFKGGLWPFFGDFIDLAALHFVTDGADNWQYNLDPTLGSPVVHAVWTDNRDVVAPLDGDWSSYVPPGDGTPRQSIFDPGEMVPVCSPGTDPTVIDRTKMRNQNIYTSKLTQGLAVAVPGNNRPLGVIQRAFVGFVQNFTDEDKLFRLQILNQPVGGSASFDQFAPETQIDAVVERGSSIAQTIYVTSSDPSASIEISVVEVDLAGNPVVDGLSATTRINPDSTAPVPNEGNILLEEIYTPALFNPALFNPALFNSAFLGTESLGLSNPALFNPALFNSSVSPEFIQAALIQMSLLTPALFNPALFNPALLNGALLNPALFNPALFNPALLNFSTANPALLNPALFNPALLNPALLNPALFNPALLNPALLNTTMVETSVVVENTGNTTAAYSLNLDLGDLPEGFIFQVMVYKINLLPSVDGCILQERVEQELLVNEFTPDVSGSLLNPESTSFFVAPGDFVISSVRIVPDTSGTVPQGDPATINALDALNLSQSVVPQAVDTAGLANFETEPTAVVVLSPALSLSPFVITTSSLPDGTIGALYSASLSTSGGSPSNTVAWSIAPLSVLPPGLSLTPGGQITGTPTTQGVFNFVVRANDSDQVTEQSISQTVTPPVVVAIPPGWTPNPNGTDAVFLWDNGFGRLDSTSVKITTATRSVFLANPGWRSDEIALIDPSQTYEASVFTFTPDGGVGHIPAIQFFDSNGAFLGTIGATGPSGIVDPNDLWVPKTFSFIPLASAASMRFIVVQDIETTQGSATTVFFDDVVLRTNDGISPPGPNLVPNPFFRAVNPTVNYKEQLDGDISGNFGLGPIFMLGAGANTVAGAGNGPDPVDIFDFDVFSIVIPGGHKLASITLLDWGAPFPPTFMRIRPCTQLVGCSFQWTITGLNATPGSIVAEVAAIPLDLPEFTFNNSGGSRTSGVPYRWIFVVEPTGAVIDSIVLSTTTATIGGPPVPYTVDMTNFTGSPLSTVFVQAFVDQPGASRAAGGSNVLCGLASGVLPPGSCSFGRILVPSNAPAAGSGTLTAGPATARIELRIFDGINTIILDTVTIPITLVDP